MVRPPKAQMLRRAVSGISLSQGRRRLLPSTSPSFCAGRRDAHRRHQKRHLAVARGTGPLRAQPHKFVAGATTRQLEESKAMRDWYAANFEGWEQDSDVTIAGEEAAEAEEEEAGEEEAGKTWGKPENPSAIELPERLTKRNIRPLVAYLRDPREEGSRACRKLRNPSVNDPKFPLIPGILHGSDPTRNIVSVDASSKVMLKTPWFEIQRELDMYHWGINGTFENRVYALTVFPSHEASLDHHRGRQPKDRTTYHVDDETATLVVTPPPPLPTPPPRTPVEGMENILVIPTGLQMHPVVHRTYCLNYVRYHPNKPIKIPLRSVNEEESPTIKRGGFLYHVNRFMECLVEDGAPIPEYIGVDCTGLMGKEVVRRGERLMIPEGVTIHPRVPDDFLLGTVFGVRGGDAEKDGAEGEEE